MKPVCIGGRMVGDGQPAFVVAEIGINHNGDVELAKRLIDAACGAGCDAVKFQKRTVEVVYSPEELARPRESPWGTTNGDLKRHLEFGQAEYEEIDAYCRQKGILWFASPWDVESVAFLEQFDPPCHKVASACLTDETLLRRIRATGRPVILSTGMSTMAEIEAAVETLGRDNLVLMHCTSTYPCPHHELNLRVIETLKRRFGVPVGYSGHEPGVQSSLVAVAVGACAIERHVTLNRTMWGSDHAASLEPYGLFRLVRDIRLIPTWLGDGRKVVYDSEKPVRQKLRRVQTAAPALEVV